MSSGSFVFGSFSSYISLIFCWGVNNNTKKLRLCQPQEACAHGVVIYLLNNIPKSEALLAVDLYISFLFGIGCHVELDLSLLHLLLEVK